METPEALSANTNDTAGGGFELPALLVAIGLFVSLFLPWYTSFWGWGLRVGDEAGLLALGVVLLELVRLMGSWRSHSASLVAFCLTAAAGIMGVSTFVVFRWGSGAPIKFSSLRYGAWVGLATGILLIVVAVLQLNSVRRTAQ
ncbi:MAG TPA: hypothetical protein VGH46_04760 [Gaiellaceae bacterium]